VCLMFLVSNKLDLNQETRFTIPLINTLTYWACFVSYEENELL